MTDTVDVANAIVAYTCACFAAISVVVNAIILKILYRGRRFPYTSNYFYIGSGIDIFSLVANHTLAVLPSRGWFLSFFLSSTLPGRLFLFSSWGTRTSQGMSGFLIALNRATAVVFPLRHAAIWSSWLFRGLALTVQFFGVFIGIVAATRDVYWVHAEGGGCYIQFVRNQASRLFFVTAFVIMSILLVFVIVLYAVLIHHLRDRKASTNSMERKQDISLLHIAIFVCTQEIIYYITYAYAFVMETNFEAKISDLRIFYIGYFIINDCYGGISPYLLLCFSKPVARDFVRELPFVRRKVYPKATTTETRA